MNILLTNDDGIYAEGLWALHNRLAAKNAVVIAAPEQEQSAVGHGITLHTPLRAATLHLDGKGPAYSISGTPADCIKLGLLELLEEKPDMVVSGINSGANVGVNLNYSGTVAAAKEAALYGINAIAVSMQAPVDSSNFAEAAEFVETVIDRVADRGLPFGTFLNINLPNMAVKDTKGIRISRQGTQFFDEYFKKREDPRKRVYYWHGCDSDPWYEHPDIDGRVICDHYISITPIKCDMTDYRLLDELKQWF
ncbi:MAG: 5'/3'-nucleotidase SurE [Desulfobacterales bacterium]